MAWCDRGGRAASSPRSPSAQFANAVLRCWPWISTFSGLAIMMAALAFNRMDDALRPRGE